MSARAPIKTKPTSGPAPKRIPSPEFNGAAVLRGPQGNMLAARDLPAGIVPVSMGRAQLIAIDGAPITESRSWSAVAYSGGVFAQWFSGKCIIDLDTMSLPGGSIPTRLSHQEAWEPWDPDKSTRIGFAESVVRVGNTIQVSGQFLENKLADRVRLDAGQGYPWEVSIIAFGRWEIVPEGQTVIVNGIEMSGGSCILRNSELRAVDFVELGADANTQILELVALAAQHGITLNRGAAAQNGARPMTTTTLPAAAGGTASLEAIDPADITMDWLKEHKPELVDAIKEEGAGEGSGDAAAANGEGYDADKDKAEMSLPATVATLKALPGATPEFVIASLEANLTLPAATAKLNASLVERLQAAERKAELAAKGSGTDPISTASGAGVGSVKLTGTDPQKDWEVSAELRAHFAKECGDESRGRTAFLKAATSCKEHGESYLDMIPGHIR